MHRIRRPTDAVQWYMGEKTARIVAESSRACDRFHIGKLILQSLKNFPEFIAQIDGATDESETNQSLLERSVRCATALRTLGVKSGDVIVVMAPNHLHAVVPIYAAMYLGVTVAPIDRNRSAEDLQYIFKSYRPKVVFCQSDKVEDIEKAIVTRDDTEIITFDNGFNYQNFKEFNQKYGDHKAVEEFKPSDFDTETTTAILQETSGTTNLNKAVEFTHKIYVTTLPYNWMKFTNFPGPTRMSITVTQLQWFTAMRNFILCPIYRITRLQSSLEFTAEHARYLINKYKPSYMIVGPTLLRQLVDQNETEQCDLTCFEVVQIGGNVVPKTLIEKLKNITPKTDVYNAYAMTETAGLFEPVNLPVGSCGQPLILYQYRLINIETKEDITEPYEDGELWVKGPGLFKGYFNNPTTTQEVFQDGWFKTGDLLYRDEHWNFFYVDRIKMLLKLKGQQISSVELESVIRRHAALADVVVTGVPSVDGDLPVACVVTRPGTAVTADDIMELVRNNLEEPKWLQGVIFMDKLPVTSTSKINRRKVKELAIATLGTQLPTE